jgi:hypothetical protein
MRVQTIHTNQRERETRETREKESPYSVNGTGSANAVIARAVIEEMHVRTAVADGQVVALYALCVRQTNREQTADAWG